MCELNNKQTIPILPHIIIILSSFLSIDNKVNNHENEGMYEGETIIIICLIVSYFYVVKERETFVPKKKKRETFYSIAVTIRLSCSRILMSMIVPGVILRVNSD